MPKHDTSSSKSIPDQQPAAPKVVLPVLEPSVSSTNIAKQAQEAEKIVEEKDGHYFMKVNRETNAIRYMTVGTHLPTEIYRHSYF